MRNDGNIVVTNPDMLHSGILPHHTSWVRLFQHLRYIVIDELHAYRGLFGSHLANVLRRLLRLCRFYGSNPTVIACSATIANPRELAEKLLERPVQLVDRNGAPRAARRLWFWNPPLVDGTMGVRRSATLEARRLMTELLTSNLQTIAFTRSRSSVEVLLTYLQRLHPAPREGGTPPVRGYRGGYLPLERRAIEAGLRDGSVRGVVSTNALELGIDIGNLDAAILVGYPGSIASTWQQLGRAGRRDSESLGVFIATDSPLDQFLVNNPRVPARGAARARAHQPRQPARARQPPPGGRVRARLRDRRVVRRVRASTPPVRCSTSSATTAWSIAAARATTGPPTPSRPRRSPCAAPRPPTW